MKAKDVFAQLPGKIFKKILLHCYNIDHTFFSVSPFFYSFICTLLNVKEDISFN